MEQLFTDLRLAVRLLVKSPAFTLVAVVSLALGIGANTTIFSLLNALLLQPLPGREPARLATVYTSDFSGPLYSASSYPDYLDFRAQAGSFDGLAAFGVLPVVMTDRGESRRVVGQFVSGNFFEVLGLGAAYGRALLPAEDDPGAPPAAVVSDAFWRSHFARKADQRAFVGPARQAVVAGVVRGIEKRLARQRLAAEEQRHDDQAHDQQRGHFSRHARPGYTVSPRVTAQSQPSYAPSCSRARRASSMVMPLMV